MSMASFGAMFRRDGGETVDLGPGGYSHSPNAEGGEEILKTPLSGGVGGAFPTTGRKTSFPSSSPFPTTPKRQATFPPTENRPNTTSPFRNSVPMGERSGGTVAGVRMNTLQEEENRSQMNRLA